MGSRESALPDLVPIPKLTYMGGSEVVLSLSDAGLPDSTTDRVSGLSHRTSCYIEVDVVQLYLLSPRTIIKYVYSTQPGLKCTHQSYESMTSVWYWHGVQTRNRTVRLYNPDMS